MSCKNIQNREALTVSVNDVELMIFASSQEA